MPYTDASGPKIYYETSGDPSHPPLVLIEGLGSQLIGWRDGFVDRLTRRGLFVIRLDNRDVGLSDKLGGPTDLVAGYTLADMADDVCRTLDALCLASAHVVGQSMGGAIAQAMAIYRPERIRSMVLVYTSPAFEPGYLTDEVLERVASMPPPSGSMSRDEAIEFRVANERYAGSTAYAFDEAWIREMAARSFDRCHRPDGIARQQSAMIASGDRRADLHKVSIPTAVIHGRGDRLIRAEASIEIARLIEGAELHLYPGMGHQVVEPLWEEFANIIVRTVGRADG